MSHRNTSNCHREVKHLLTSGREVLMKGITFLEDLFLTRLGDYPPVSICEK